MALTGSGTTSCSTCRETVYPFEGPHTCKPLWRVWNPEYGDDFEDARQIHAVDAGNAAMAWAQRYDQDTAKYSIAHGESVTLLVVADGDAEANAVAFEVEAELVPLYRSAPVEENRQA